MTDVVALFGGPTGVPEVNQTCVESLERWLEMARSGQVIGIAVAAVHCDGLAQYECAGRVGGYSMIGAVAAAKAGLLEINAGSE